MYKLPCVENIDELTLVMADLIDFHFMSKLPQHSEKDLAYMESLVRVCEQKSLKTL